MWLSAWVFAHVLAPEALMTPTAQAVADAASKAEGACVSTSKSVPQEWCTQNCAIDPAGEACKSACKCPPSLLKKHETEVAAKEAKASLLGTEGQWPRVLLLGTQKGATTAFARTFEKAGLCSSTQGKECHVLVKEISNMEFPENTSASVTKYTSQFTDRDFSGNTNCSVRGHYDGNPFLLTDRGAPVFLRTFMPHNLQAKVRLIASLREPTGRMLSWHNHHRFTGPDPRVFAAHAASEIEVWMENGNLENAHNGVQNFWANMSKHSQWVHSPPLDMMIGMYEHGIKWWRAHWPRDQLFIINYDHFVYENTTLLKALGNFMDLDLVDEPMPHVNLHSATERSIAAMCCETYCALQLAAYRSANEGLYQMMDADSADHAGPKGELPFGRYSVPSCVACDNSTTAERILATCAPPKKVSAPKVAAGASGMPCGKGGPCHGQRLQTHGGGGGVGGGGGAGGGGHCSGHGSGHGASHGASHDGGHGGGGGGHAAASKKPSRTK